MGASPSRSLVQSAAQSCQAGEHRGAEIADLALASEVVQRPQRLLQRRRGVGPVQLIEVEMIGLEPAQASLDLRHDVVAAAPPVIRPLTHLVVDLRGQHNPVAPALDGLSDQLLRPSLGVDVGGVQHVNPGIERGMHQGDCRSGFDPPTELRRPQPQGRDPHTRAAQLAILHRSIPLRFHSITGPGPAGTSSFIRSSS